MKLTERLSICWRILRAEPGNCMEHADRELPPADGDEMQALMNQNIKEMVLVFGTHGHSGFSASYAIASLEKILRFQPLRPLTGGPEEWGETFDGRCRQNKRAGNVFIGDPQRFEGQAYDIEAIVFREPTGSCFTGKGSAQPVIFPYTPRTIYVDVDAEGNPLDGWNREGVYPGWSYGAKDDTALRTLPPLPAPAYSGPDGTGNFSNLYTAAQVEEIRRTAILAERESAADLVLRELGDTGQAQSIAAAIREGDK